MTVHHRITPKHGAFRIEAVTAAGAIEVLSMWASEDQAVEQLRVLQCDAERHRLQSLAQAESTRGPRGKPVPAVEPI